MIAEVIVDITSSEVDRVFDYNVGELNVVAGTRVCVPFANRKIEGVVIKLKQFSNLPSNKIKMPFAINHKIDLIASHIQLAESCWIANVWNNIKYLHS